MNVATFSSVNADEIWSLESRVGAQRTTEVRRKSGEKVNIKVAARLRYATRLPRFSLLKNGQAGSGLY